jgi:dTDP-4-amino-4,6-dideoxygalactose transaminase
MTHVTRTYLPNKEKFLSYVERIYASGWLTNNGQFVQELERKLAEFLGVKRLLLVANGTLALQAAYKLLGIRGDVLTTPFSFVATTSSLVWEGLNPIFVDIDKETFNLDPSRIERALTASTSAIVATHVYGNACDLEAIDRLARKHEWKVIYDAAHAFHVRYGNESILNFGDISTISFHSTKIFHTIEGGAIVISDDELFERAKRLINFGIEGPSVITGLGVNMKMNEFQAAMGLCMLDEIEQNLRGRKLAYDTYMQGLLHLDGLAFQKRNPACTDNYSHFPVLFESEELLLRIMERLRQYQIYPRRYFYPSLETLPYLSSRQTAPNSSDIARRIVCLPLYDGIEEDVQLTIVTVIREELRR